jgi:hypothetical protein
MRNVAMTTDILIAPPRSIRRNFAAELFRREPRFAGATLCLLALMPPTLFAMGLDQRTLLDINVWVKPLKFEIALILYLSTLSWFAGWLPDKVRAARWYTVFSTVVILAIAAEMIWIVGAAALGVASHFNTSSAFMIAAYAVMGVLAVLLTSATLVYGVTFLRDRTSALAPGFRWSLGLGLVLTFVLTVVVAGTMSSNGSHFIGGNMSDAEAWPIMGWARDGGDLRVAHFFATHAMHVVPIFGFLLTPLLSLRTGQMAVIGFGAFYAAFTFYTFGEAILGRPFLGLIM